MRCTHGYGICSHFHLCVKNSHRNLKCGISVFVHRLIFFAIHDHVIVIRAAPDDGCCSFFVFDLYFGRRFYRCSSGSACEESSFLSVSSVVSSTSPVFTGSLTLTLWSYHLPFSPRSATSNSSSMAGTGISNP